MFFLIASSLFLVFYLFFLVLSNSWHSFSWFSSINLLFRVSYKKISFCCWTEVAKNSSFWKKLVFLDFYHFCFWFVFSCMIFKNILPLFFQWLWTISCFFCFCSKKKTPPKNLILFILCLLSLLLLFLFSALFFCFLFSLTMFPLFVSALVMFFYSLSYVSFSLCLLCFFCLIVFLITFICFLFFLQKKTFFFHLFIAFCETVFVLSPLLFRLFFLFVRSNKINWPFFSE